jgi:2-keto-3-deoxy-L-rhamnonate aldolase RhmA
MIGTFLTIDSVICSEILSKDLDFIIIDREHAAHSLGETRNLMNACCEECEKFVRVHSCERIEIQRVLELNPDGIFIPQISSLEDAKNAISFSLYAPLGTRGLSPYTRPFDYSPANVNIQKTSINKKLKIAFLIEGQTGIEALSDILKGYSNDISVIYFGLYDFSSSLNLEADWENQKVKNGLHQIVSLCKTFDVNVGTIARTHKEISILKELGVKYIVFQNDVGILKSGLDKIATYK